MNFIFNDKGEFCGVYGGTRVNAEAFQEFYKDYLREINKDGGVEKVISGLSRKK